VIFLASSHVDTGATVLISFLRTMRASCWGVMKAGRGGVLGLFVRISWVGLVAGGATGSSQ
jgi:hypothetical protein